MTGLQFVFSPFQERMYVAAGVVECLLAAASGAPTADEIHNLPGLTYCISFKHSSGYLSGGLGNSNSPPLTDCPQSLKHRRNAAFLSIFCRYFHYYCSSQLANSVPTSSRGLAAQDSILSLTPILSTSVMQTNIFIHSLI